MTLSGHDGVELWNPGSMWCICLLIPRKQNAQKMASTLKIIMKCVLFFFTSQRLTGLLRVLTSWCPEICSESELQAVGRCGFTRATQAFPQLLFSALLLTLAVPIIIAVRIPLFLYFLTGTDLLVWLTNYSFVIYCDKDPFKLHFAFCHRLISCFNLQQSAICARPQGCCFSASSNKPAVPRCACLWASEDRRHHLLPLYAVWLE